MVLTEPKLLAITNLPSSVRFKKIGSLAEEGDSRNG